MVGKGAAHIEAPQHLKYTPLHYWVQMERNRAVFGLTEYAEQELGIALFIDLPEIDSCVRIGEWIGSIETVEREQDLFAPLSGRIAAVNDRLGREPALLNADPYGQWIAIIDIADDAELDALWSAETYSERFAEPSGR